MTLTMVAFIECPECDGRGRYALTNANDSCARLYVCELCNGAGEIEIEDEDEA
jgi:DnaJ-class molecular chaperone